MENGAQRDDETHTSKKSAQRPASRKTRPKPSPDPVRVTLSVTTFRDIATEPGERRYTDAMMTVEPHPHAAKVTLNGKEYLRITRPQANTGLSKRRGRDAFHFNNLTMDDWSITIPDGFDPQQPADSAITYEFFVMIQASDGRIGIIDPGIENSEEPN